MSGEEKKPGDIAFGWWSAYIEPRDKNAAARGLSARLRRSGPVAALCEPAVHELARALNASGRHAEKLVRLVCLLAEVRQSDPESLANRLGGKEPALSCGRFENLMRAEDSELTALLRRTILMADRRCNVATLSGDLWNWNDTTRTRWCFAYFKVDAPQEDSKETV